MGTRRIRLGYLVSWISLGLVESGQLLPSTKGSAAGTSGSQIRPAKEHLCTGLLMSHLWSCDVSVPKLMTVLGDHNLT